MSRRYIGFQDEDELLREEKKHTRRGACLALILVPLLVCGLCTAVERFTPRGRMVSSFAVTWVAYNGLGLPEAVNVPVLNGFPGIARWACQLEQQTPPPSPETMQTVQTIYEELFTTYTTARREFMRNGGSPDTFVDPDQIPGNFASAKLYYCAR